jgi:uncharacterized membrane protein SpoIIM required for sporulation
MDVNHFLRSRQERWQRLSDLLDRIDRRGLSGLSAPEADEFFRLYRLTSSDLNLVQTRTGNPTVVDYLEGLVGRAYGCLAVPRRPAVFRSWWMILRHYFPAAVRAEIPALCLSAAVFLAGTVLGLVATTLAPKSADAFLSEEYLDERPSQRVARLESGERAGHSQITSPGEHSVFTVFLFTHNIRVSVLAFALGLTFGIGTLVVLFYNGAMLGALAALYWADGVFTFFIAWVGPHGSLELPCVVLAGTAGLLLARTQLRRGRGSIGAQVREIRPRIVDLLVGSATLLVLAGAIEGGFSQINQPTLPYALKIAVAAALFAALLAYLFWVPVTPRPAAEDAAMDHAPGPTAVGGL